MPELDEILNAGIKAGRSVTGSSELSDILNKGLEPKNESTFWNILSKLNVPRETIYGALSGGRAKGLSDVLLPSSTPTSSLGKAAKGLAGFALDVVDPLDPLNWIGLGQVKNVARATGAAPRMARQLVSAEMPWLGKVAPSPINQIFQKGEDKLNDILSRGLTGKINEAIPAGVGKGLDAVRATNIGGKAADSLSSILGTRPSNVGEFDYSNAKQGFADLLAGESSAMNMSKQDILNLNKVRAAFEKKLRLQNPKITNEQINNEFSKIYRGSIDKSIKRKRGEDVIFTPEEQILNTIRTNAIQANKLAREESGKMVQAGYEAPQIFDLKSAQRNNRMLDERLRQDPNLGRFIKRTINERTGEIKIENIKGFANAGDLEANLYFDPVNNVHKKVSDATFSELAEAGYKFQDSPDAISHWVWRSTGGIKGQKAFADTIRASGKKLDDPQSQALLAQGWRKIEGNKLLEDTIFPAPFARFIENQTKKIQSPESVKSFLKIYDPIQNELKKLLTFYSPAFNIRNMSSGAITNIENGANNPLKLLSSYKKSIGQLKNFRSGLIDADTKLASELGVFNTGQLGSDVGESIESVIKAPKRDKIRPVRKAVKGFEDLARSGENLNRLSLFNYKIAEGMNPKEAAKFVREVHFDYSDITGFEKDVLKRLIPFYTFMRKNIPYQIAKTFTSPRTATPYLSLKNNMEKQFEDSESINKGLMGEDYLNRNIIQVPGDKQYIGLKGLIPKTDIGEISPTKLLTMLGEGVTPLLKTPAEVIRNESFFTNQPISKFEGEKVKKLGMNIDPRIAHIMNLVRPLSDIERATKVGKENGIPAGLLKFLTGVSPVKFDESKAVGGKLYQMNSELSKIRKAVKNETDEDLKQQYEQFAADLKSKIDALTNYRKSKEIVL